jgi:hypothetical protein
MGGDPSVKEKSLVYMKSTVNFYYERSGIFLQVSQGNDLQGIFKKNRDKTRRF